MYKKQIFILLFIFFLNYLFCVQKPIIKFGINSKSLFNKIKEESIYPETLNDSIYFYYNQEICSFFEFYYKINFNYTNNNKNTKNLDSLQYISLNNIFNLLFKLNKYNNFILKFEPILDYRNKQSNVYLNCFFKYNIITNNFNFSTYYSNKLNFNETKISYHNFGFSFLWNDINYKFIKFKSSINFNFQHNLYNKLQLNYLNGVKFNFEIAIDFRKINIENIFEINEENEFLYFE